MSSLYISFDLETVGDDPWDLTIINAGFVAYCCKEDGQRTRMGQLSVNFQPGKANPKQLEWWHSTPELARTYASFEKDAKPPAQAMEEIRDWIAGLRIAREYANTYMVAMPTIFDGSFLYAYWMRFLPSPKGARGTGLYAMIDVRSYGAGRLGCTYDEANKTRAFVPYMPDPELAPHTHTGVDDAEEQVQLLFNLMDRK